MKQILQNKAIIMLEGNDVATGLKWALLSDSVVMMQPPSFTSWAMEELLEPWVHYIPLNEDLSDVEEKMQWILDNDKKAQLIAQRGTLWIQDLILHPDAANDEKRIQEEIIRRYRAHFSATEKATVKKSSTPTKSLRSSPSASSKNLMFLAFYYPWYKRDDWTQHGTQGSTPLLGHYGSEEIEVAERHIDMAVRGGIDAWVVSWWKKDDPVTVKFNEGMLKAKNMDKIKFCMIYESMGALPVAADFQKNGTLVLDKFISDMVFFRDTYFGHPSYLHINGRPVVYVYITRYWKKFEPFMLDKIKKAVGEDILIIADDPFFGHNLAPTTAQNGIKNGKPVFEAYTAYNMYESDLVQQGESAVDYMFREALPIFERWSRETVFFPSVLPKYHDFREGHKPLVGDVAGLLAQLKTFACLPRPAWFKNKFPDLMFVTTFNEWWEGTSIEPDAEDAYGYKFLDTIKAFKDSGVQCEQKQSVD
jgi:hypothetical protein